MAPALFAFVYQLFIMTRSAILLPGVAENPPPTATLPCPGVFQEARIAA